MQTVMKATDHDPVAALINLWIDTKFKKTKSVGTRDSYTTTMRMFRTHVNAQGGDLNMADPRVTSDPEHGATFLALAAQTFAYADGLAATTTNHHLAVLTSFYKFALRQGLLHGINPIERVERRKVVAYDAARSLHAETIFDGLAAIDISRIDGLRDRAILLLGIFTGRRVDEIASLRYSDIVMRAHSVEIDYARVKGGESDREELPLAGDSAIIAEAILAYIQKLDEAAEHTPGIVAYEGADRPLWISFAHNDTYGHGLSRFALAQICQRHFGTSKFHSLRHTLADNMRDVGATTEDIQHTLRHKQISTTSRYLTKRQQVVNPYLERLVQQAGLKQ